MANNKIKGLTVEIGGDTTKLSDALGEVDKNGYKLQGNLKEVERLLKLDPTNTELLAERQKILAKSVENTESKLAQLKEVQGQITQQYQNGDIDQGAYLAFQRELITTERQLEQLNDNIEDSGEKAKKSGVSMEALAGGVKKVASAAGSISAASFKAVTAAVKTGITAVTAYGGAIGGAAAAAFKFSADAGAMADDVNTLSKVTGISTEQLQIYSLYSAQVDVETETIAKAMQKLTVNMGDAADGSASATAKFDKLGVSVKDINGNLKSNDEVFAEAIEKLGEIENETERDAIAMDLFGKSAQELNPLILGGADAFREMGEAAKANGLILSQEALDSLNAFNDSIDNLKSNVSGAGNVLAGVFAPKFQMFTDIVGVSAAGVITSVADIFSGEALDGSGLTDKLSEMGAGISDTLISLTPDFIGGFNTVILSVAESAAEVLPDTVSGMLPILLDGFDGLVGGLADYAEKSVSVIASGSLTMFGGVLKSLNTVSDKLMKQLPKIITDLTGKLNGALPQMVSSATALFTGLVTGVANAVPSITATVTTLVPTVVTALMESLPLIIDAGFQLLTSLVGALPDIVITVVEAVPQIVTGIIDTLMSAVPQIIDTGVELLVSLIDALPEIITTIVDAIPEIITGIIKTVVGAVPKFIGAGIRLFTALIGALPDIIVSLVAAIPQIVDGLVGGLTESIPILIEAGILLFTAIVEDVPAIIKGLVAALPKIIEGLVNGFSQFGSTMMGVGKNLIEGIWNGISNAKDWLVEKISGFFDGIVDYIKDFFGIASPSKLFRDDVGKYLAQGIGVGFEGEMGAVTKQMQAALPTKFDTDVTLGGGLQSTAQQHGAASKNVSFTQNIYAPKALSRAEIAANTRSMLQLANAR